MVYVLRPLISQRASMTYEGWIRVAVRVLRALYTLRQSERLYYVTSNLTEKLSKLHSFDWQ
jgi:hypothetical protein